MYGSVKMEAVISDQSQSRGREKENKINQTYQRFGCVSPSISPPNVPTTEIKNQRHKRNVKGGKKNSPNKEVFNY